MFLEDDVYRLDSGFAVECSGAVRVDQVQPRSHSPDQSSAAGPHFSQARCQTASSVSPRTHFPSSLHPSRKL
jgi:hypothetical protein